MTPTQKETSFLTDLKGQEELCIGKYERYAAEAKTPELRALFEDMKKTEQSHLETIRSMMGGTVPETPATLKANNDCCCAAHYASDSDRQSDAFLCRDMLSAEKHVSSVYDMSVFEFQSPTLRDTLAHIQKEEQNHGEQLYNYLSCNNMYS